MQVLFWQDCISENHILGTKWGLQLIWRKLPGQTLFEMELMCTLKTKNMQVIFYKNCICGKHVLNICAASNLYVLQIILKGQSISEAEVNGHFTFAL